LFLDHVDAALHVEVPLWNFIVLAIENFFEAADGLSNRDVLAGSSSEDFRHMKWLAKEALNLARAKDSQLVVGRQLVHSQDGDDVLQILIALQDLLDAACYGVVVVSDNFRSQRFGGGGKGIDCRIDTELSNRTFQHDGGI